MIRHEQIVFVPLQCVICIVYNTKINERQQV